MSGPLRVLMVSPQFRPMVGGYERAAERLSQALAARGHRVTVVAERRDPEWLAREESGGISVRRLRVVTRSGLHILTGVFALVGYLLVHGRSYDVYHVHQYGWAAAVSVVFGRLYRRPVVLKLTATGEGGIASVLRRARFGSLLRRLHRGVDACLASSERVAADAAGFGIAPDRIHRIPNGIDTESLRPLPGAQRASLRRELGVETTTVVLYVGRLSAVKNPLGLVDAWQKLGSPADATLVFAGDGPEREELAARASRCADSVRLLGFVSNPLVWYQAADVFVLPSIREGLSNSLLEALACALPVVSTPVSGSEDIFAAADVGVLVPRSDAAALADGLQRLLSDPDHRRHCGAEARRVALERFSIDRVTREVESLYRQLLQGRPASPV